MFPQQPVSPRNGSVDCGQQIPDFAIVTLRNPGDPQKLLDLLVSFFPSLFLYVINVVIIQVFVKVEKLEDWSATRTAICNFFK